MVGVKDRERLRMVQETEFKELLCTTHGHELRRGECWRVWGVRGGGGVKEEKLGKL